MEKKREFWHTRRMAKELVTELISKIENWSLMELCRTVVVEDFVSEVTLVSEVDNVVCRLIDGMEERLQERLRKREKDRLEEE